MRITLVALLAAVLSVGAFVALYQEHSHIPEPPTEMAHPRASTGGPHESLTFGDANMKMLADQVLPDDGTMPNARPARLTVWGDGTMQVRVMVVEMKDAAAVETFLNMAKQGVLKAGGIFENYKFGDVQTFRSIEPASDHVAIHYLLIGRDGHSLHIASTHADAHEQETVDGRFRALLDHAQWKTL
jgi:hypothetical protein